MNNEWLSIPPDPLSILFEVGLRRQPRHPCTKCGKRRVLFVLTVFGAPRGLALCATCAGISGFRTSP